MKGTPWVSYFRVTIYAWIYSSNKKSKITDPKFITNQNHLSDEVVFPSNDNFKFNWTL